MMGLQILGAPALLASPAIALEYLLAKLAIRETRSKRRLGCFGTDDSVMRRGAGQKAGNPHYRTSQGPNGGRAFPSLPSIAALLMLLS